MWVNDCPRAVLFRSMFYFLYRSCVFDTDNSRVHALRIDYQSEMPRSIPLNSLELDHGCTPRIYFDNAGDNLTLALYNVKLKSQKPC